MRAEGKVLVGVILVLASAWWILQGADQYLGSWTSHRRGVADLITVLDGIVPVVIFLLGIFIVWLELDEMKVEKEIKKRK